MIEHAINANEAVHFHFINKMNLSDPMNSFLPEYTYPFFGDSQSIKGYEEVSVDIFIKDDTFKTYIQENVKGKSKDAVDPVTTILTILSPCQIYTSVDSFFEDFTKPFIPPGRLEKEYVPAPSYNLPPDDNVTYQIYCGPIINEDIKSYQRRLSAMPFFLIDSASFIENKDDHWDVYLIFKKTRLSSSSSPCDVHYSIIGFATVYRFFRFPDRTRMRISQFIVFPSYHRQGHASCLLDCIYQRSKRNRTVDITLELQSPHFKIMRTVVDMLCLRKYGIFQFRKGEVVIPLKSVNLNQIREKVPIIDAQITNCYYVLKWRAVDQSNVQEDTAFRLELKRHLYNTLPDELCGLSMRERKEKLTLLYTTMVAQIRIISAAYDKHADFVPMA